MDDRLARLEAAVAALAGELSEVRARLAQLETAPADTPSTTSIGTAPFARDVSAGVIQDWIGLVGRTLVILGGAYLLRALTDAHVVPAATGVALGLAYGAPWLLLAARSGSRGAQLDAFSYGLATALIGFPLVWEATYRFAVLSPAQSAALLTALTAGALVLSVARGLQSLAWIVTIGALAAAFSLAIATSAWLPYATFVVALGVATLWLGYAPGWVLLRWLPAAVANLMIVIVTGRALSAGSVRLALALQALAVAGYFGSFAVRTLAGSHRVVPFEIAQGAVLLAVSLGGTVMLLGSSSATLVLGAAVLAAGLGLYGSVFMLVRHRRTVGALYFYSVLALVLTLVGSALCVGAARASAIYAFCGVATALLAMRQARLWLAVQTTVFVVAAAAASGLLTTATLAIARPPAEWPALDGFMAIAFAAAAIAPALRLRRPVDSWGAWSCIPQTVLLWMVAWLCVGLGTATAVRILGSGGALDAAALSTIRTGVFVVAALIAALASRTVLAREAGWLAYPILVLTGLKIVLVDFPQGRPSTLFIALAMYGAALILAGRASRTYFVSSP